MLWNFCCCHCGHFAVGAVSGVANVAVAVALHFFNFNLTYPQAFQLFPVCV